MNTEIDIYPKFSHPETIEKYRFLPQDTNCPTKEYLILPDGYFELAFLLSDTRCIVVLAGPYTQKTIVPIDGFELFVIRFRIGNTPKLLDIKSSELVNTMVPLSTVFGMPVDQLCEMLVTKKELTARQRVVEEIIHKQEFRPIAESRIYNQATLIIEKREGQVKVKEIANVLDVSIRTLERQFKEILGFPPKQFIRLVRFQKTVEKLKRMNKFRNLTDIAYESGYSDQAHFIKDFKLLSGKPPLVFSK